MNITTFLSVNNENLGAIARMLKFAPKQGFQKYVWVTTALRSTLDIAYIIRVFQILQFLNQLFSL